jgi:AhpD family alkylhydroperoxidase
MKKNYKKRMYNNFKQFICDICFVISRLPRAWETLIAKRVSRAFAEKIMLAVTAVNECVHCSRGHSKLALVNGAEQSEIDQLLAQDIGQNVDEYEVTALAFAQHYAESERNPDPAALAALEEMYGKKIARDIILYTRMISIANLVGNTLDGFLARFRGESPDQGKLFFELIFMMVLPLVLMIVPILYLPITPEIIAVMLGKSRDTGLFIRR